MDKKISSLESGPIISVSNLEESLKAQNLGARLLLFKRNDVLDVNIISNIIENIDLQLIVPCKPNNMLEAKVLNHIGVQIIYEMTESNEEVQFLNKNALNCSFISDGYDLGYCLRRINEGANMVMIKLEDLNKIKDSIFEYNKYKNINSMIKFSKAENVPLELVKECAELNTLPVPLICSSKANNVFEIVSIKSSNFSNYIINSNILNQDCDNLEKIKKVIQSNEENDISLILNFFNMKNSSQNIDLNESSLIESTISSDLISIESSQLDLSDK